jgi:hypothetical protein
MIRTVLAHPHPQRQGFTGKLAVIAASRTEIAIFQLKDFNWEIGMDTPGQFRKYAADCETMSKVSRDPETGDANGADEAKRCGSNAPYRPISIKAEPRCQATSSALANL